MRIHYATISLLLLLLLACEHDSYDTGDGKYSHLQTDYVSVEVKDCYVQSITTDDDKPLSITAGMRIDVEPKDTVLRWLLYYNKVSDSNPIEIVGRSNMTLLKVRTTTDADAIKTDPVTMTSAWLSKNKRYLNLNIGLKMGSTTSNTQLHTVGMVCTGMDDDTAYYTFYHDQGNIPQYYTQDVLFTVECPDKKVIDLTINTYNGTWHKQLIIDN